MTSECPKLPEEFKNILERFCNQDCASPGGPLLGRFPWITPNMRGTMMDVYTKIKGYLNRKQRQQEEEVNKMR